MGTIIIDFHPAVIDSILRQPLVGRSSTHQLFNLPAGALIAGVDINRIVLELPG